MAREAGLRGLAEPFDRLFRPAELGAGGAQAVGHVVVHVLSRGHIPDELRRTGPLPAGGQQRGEGRARSSRGGGGRSAAELLEHGLGSRRLTVVVVGQAQIRIGERLAAHPPDLFEERHRFGEAALQESHDAL